MTIIIIIAIIMILAVVEWNTGILELSIFAKYGGSRDKKVMGLSFDDGPDWGEEKLIAALNETGIRATFFWTWEKVEILKGQNPARFADLLQLLKQGKHEIGIHGLSCGVPPIYNIWKRIRGMTHSNDILTAQQNFHGLLGVKSVFYRPHGFQLGRELCDSIERSGVMLVAGSLCLAIGPKEANLGRKYVRNFKKARPGYIICGHDSCDCHTDYGIASDIAHVILELGNILKDRKLEAVKLSEVIN